MNHLAATIAILVPVGLSTAVAQGPKMRLSDVLVLRAFEAKPPTGHGGYVLQADRGARKGRYVVAWTGDKQPPADVSASNAPATSEYRLLSPAKAGPLPDVDVLGIHYIKVRPDRRDAFERFVAETLHPKVGNLRPDLRMLYYKAVSGPDAGSYLTIFALTRESRDKYWPGGSDSDELRAAFSQDVKALTKELRTYLVEGSYAADEKLAAAVFESREWTDFVLVPADGR